ncbi:hypothetical protein A9Q96_10255 [Rhodobacterales bacterium 52_120_T64]|nr:hypothetical protein A9Q96_10255 [Rhodobacterales bacterium 52_120_T64]
MRGVSVEMQSRLDTGATSMCRAWLVVRRDGVRFGFTDHDRDLQIDGDVFKAGSGLDASVLEATTGLSVDNGQAVGALNDAGLTESEILAGRYDGAEVWQWLVDWSQPELKVLLFGGTFGEIRRGTGVFEVELRGITEALNQPLGRMYLRQCDRVFGDTKCGIDLGDPTFSADVTVLKTMAKRGFSFDGLSGFQDGWFTNGSIQWASGSVSIVKVDAGGMLEVWEDVDVSVGDTARVVAGCDKQSESCRVKFGNFLNFRGFPHIPGEDWVTAYPASGETHDGGSLNAE